MFRLVVLARAKHRAVEQTEEIVRRAVVTALMQADPKNVFMPVGITSIEVRIVDHEELMNGELEVHNFASAPEWVALSLDNKMKRFLESLKRELKRSRDFQDLKEGNISVLVTPAEYFSA